MPIVMNPPSTDSLGVYRIKGGKVCQGEKGHNSRRSPGIVTVRGIRGSVFVSRRARQGCPWAKPGLVGPYLSMFSPPPTDRRTAGYDEKLKTLFVSGIFRANQT